jgi:hypothetical protein
MPDEIGDLDADDDFALELAWRKLEKEEKEAKDKPPEKPKEEGKK